jgi:nucleoid-associated protein YgaU
MSTHLAFLVLVLPSVSLIFVLGALGCATEGLNPSVAAPPPLRNLGLSAQGQHATVEVIDIIQPGGPGTWSADARWTEIVIRVTNSSAMHVVGRGLSLVSVTGASLPAVENPLALPDMQQHLTRSKEQTEANSKLASQVLSSTSTAAPAFSPSASSRVNPITSSMQEMAGVVHQEQMRSLANRAQNIEAEIRRRALAPGVQLSPGDHVQGSVFFALTRSPKKLLVAYEVGRTQHTVEVMLARPQPIPTAPPGASSVDRPTEGDLLYTVKAGETLGDIAARLTGSADNWRMIAAHNGITSPSALRAGTTVMIPRSLVKELPQPR